MLVLDTAERLRHLLATDPAFKSPNMNQQCKVCNEPAAGFHFGAFTCEGCKSFFGRTYNNLGSISECKNNGECVINKKNRTSCKACRLRKCLLVGMSKSGSRYGRRSNWFKIHCLLQEQASSGSPAFLGGRFPGKEERSSEDDEPKTPSPGIFPSPVFTPYFRPLAMGNWPLRGGDLLFPCPAPGGLPLEQEQPIDLSLKSPSPQPEVDHCNKTSYPLDLTKRHQVPLLG